MSTGYGWEGIRQVYVRRCLVRALYQSASVVAVSTLGAITSVRPLPLPFTYLPNVTDSVIWRKFRHPHTSTHLQWTFDHRDSEPAVTCLAVTRDLRGVT